MAVQVLNSVLGGRAWSLRIGVSVESQQVYLRGRFRTVAVGEAAVEFAMLVKVQGRTVSILICVEENVLPIVLVVT